MMAMDSTYLKAIAMAVAVVLTIYMLLNLGSSTTSSTSFTSPQWRQNHKSAGAIAQQIQNATLGVCSRLPQTLFQYTFEIET